MTNELFTTATDLSLAAGVSASAAPAGAAASTTPSWISSLSTSSIKSDMAAADVNGVVTAQGLTKLLTDLDGTLSSSTLTSAEFTDLQTIAANLNNGLSTSSYLAYAFNALVNGNAANAYWTGGNANSVALSNLAAGASQAQLGNLIGKWFQGTDLPNSYVDMSGDSAFTVSYKTVTNAVFGASGPSMNDINQGYLGDCYFEASCAEVADMNPSYIESMFSNNGNGTYGVRFYYDGAAEYVTVNLSLADGGTEFNEATDVWASLAEKAWAQFQAINPDTGNSAYNDGNSWSSIGNGGDPAYALEALTGASLIAEFEPNGTNWNDYTYNSSLNWTGYSDLGMTTSSVLASIVAALASHDDVDITSNTYGYDSSGNETLIPDHVLSVYGYDSSTQMLEVRNPWGDFDGYHYDASTKKYYDPTFEVSLTTLLADDDWVEFDNAGLTSALPNPATIADYLNNISAYDQFVSGIQISDAATAVAASFDALNADSDIKSIALTDSGTPVLNLTATQAANDSTALGKISDQVFEVIAGGANTYYLQAGPWVSLTDANATFKLSGGAQASVIGGGDTINFTGGSGNAASLYSTGGNWDTVNASNGAVYLNSSQASINGGGDLIGLYGSGDAVSLYGTSGNWDWIVASNSSVYDYSSQISIWGGGNLVGVYGSGDFVSVWATSGNWDWMVASNSTVYDNSAQTSVWGGGDTIGLYGTGDFVSLWATSGSWDWVSGSDGTVYVNSAQTNVWGGGDTVGFYGSGDIVTLYATSGNQDWLSGSNSAINFQGAQASLWGTGDTLTFGGSSNTASLYGTSEALDFQQAFGQDVINGFASTDTLQFSKLDFASWSALSSHMSQSGANTVITLDATDTVTLTNVAMTSLTASEFKFV
jgi:hypothetical protein